jgi:quercetin dioxygenase-like cupin family protein
MSSTRPDSTVFQQVIGGTALESVDVFGPTLEFLTRLDEPGATYAVMRGVVPPGVVVPLHSHDDAEDFFILAGTQQVLIRDEQGLQWRDLHAGDYVHIPGGVPHAHRNVSDEPAVELVVTTIRLGEFFNEIARPSAAPPPTPEELAHFVEVARKYGYTLGTPEENASVGITLGG